MYLLILVIISLIVGIVLAKKSYDFEDLGVILIIVFSVVLLIQGIFFTNHYSCSKAMKKREAFRTTLNSARENGSELEKATILKDLAEWNEWVVSVQTDNEFWYDIYVPDAVDTMTLMK
jgi:hypothetical protein